MHALRQPRCTHAGSHCTTRKRAEAGTCPAPETPTEPAVEDISSNSTESLSEAEPTPEAEDTPSNSPDGEDIYSHSPTDFTEDISSGDALGDKPEGMEHKGTFTVSPTPEENSGPEPRVQPIEYTYNDGYAYEEYDEKPKKKRSFKWLFIVLPILIAIGATIGGIFWWYNAPMQKPHPARLTLTIIPLRRRYFPRFQRTNSLRSPAKCRNMPRRSSTDTIKAKRTTTAPMSCSTACKSCSRTSVSTISSTAFNR